MAKTLHQGIVFVNADKKRRAEDIYLLLTGQRMNDTNVSVEHKQYLKERFTELLSEKKVDLKNEEVSVVAIYKLLGGAVRTIEQEKKIRDSVKKAKTFAKVEKQDEEGIDADDEEAEDDEDDE